MVTEDNCIGFRAEENACEEAKEKTQASRRESDLEI